MIQPNRNSSPSNFGHHNPKPENLEGGAPVHVSDAARERLLKAALQLFAERGFANASIRDLAQKARVNVSAISYYFKDKVGLYKAAFAETFGCAQKEAQPFICSPHNPPGGIQAVLAQVLLGLVEPLKNGELSGWQVRLHMREMLEPTGIWAEQIDTHIAPAHAALEQLICQELGLSQADERVQRLAFSITGLAVHVLVSREMIQTVRPELLSGPQAIDDYVAQLHRYAVAMVNVEKARLGLPLLSNP